MAGDARAALEWIAGEPGRAFITQERIQGLCWYELPVKWFAGPGEKLRVVAALAGALDLLQLLQPAGLPAATAAGPLPPLHRAQLASLARIVRGIGVPAVVCGDFNVDRDSSLFGEAPARMLPVAPPVAPDDEFLECTETVSSHPGTGIGVFKRDAEVGDEVGCVANLALCPEDFP